MTLESVENRPVPLRLDVWLDVACLFKTRSEAQQACKGGKVDVNGQAAKPHREIKPGDVIEITRTLGRRQRVVVQGLAEQHIPKAEARLLYEDTTPPPSPEEQACSTCCGWPARGAGPRPAGTPDRRERRRLRREKEGDELRSRDAILWCFRPVKRAPSRLTRESERGLRVATRHASAVKAHRQTIKRTAHNRELRSKLRTGLKSIRAAIDAGEHADAKAALSQTFSLDRQDVRQGHHPRQRRRPLQVAPREAAAAQAGHQGRKSRRRSGLRYRPSSTPRCGSGRPVSSTTSRSSSTRSSPPELFSARSVRSSASSAGLTRSGVGLGQPRATPTSATGRPAHAASRRDRGGGRSRAARAPRRRRRSH